MESVSSLCEAKIGVWDGLKTSTVDPFSFSSGMNVEKKVKEEADDCVELSREFKTEPEESAGDMELESIPAMKDEHEEWYKIPVKQEWSETDSTVCETEPVIRNECLNLEGRQIHRLASPTLGSEGRGTSRSNSFSSSEALVRDGKDCAEEIRQDLRDSEVKAAADTDAACNVQGQRLQSDIHSGNYSTDCQQENLLDCSQVAIEEEDALKVDDLHSESNRNSVTHSVRCQAVGSLHPSFETSDKSHHTELAGQKTEVLNKISDITYDDYAGEKLFKCYVCQRVYNDKSDFIRHNKIHACERPFECSVCKKTFALKSNLNSHMKIHTGKKPFDCCVCGNKFTRNSSLTKHLRIHTGEKPFQCSVCMKRFTRKSDLSLHEKIHAGKKPFECSVCGIKFTQNSNLTKHMKIHTGEKPFQCNICMKKFTRKSDLSSHVNIHTGENPFECSICRKKFIHKSYFILHVKHHLGENRYECSVCGRKFITKSCLNRHYSIHNEIRYECGVCRKKFARISNLTSHESIHTDEKLFECNVCRKKFTRMWNLTSHERVHTGEKPFECSICEKRFTRNSYLISHARIHTDKKNY